MELSDLDLIQGCIEKDKKTWDLFVERFSKLIYWNIRKVFAAYAFSNREDLVCDVFQSVFERLIEKEELSKLKNAASVRKFLSVVSCNAALDKAKALGRSEKRNADDGILENVPTASITAKIISDERAGILERVLSGLAPKERACVEFYYFNEFTFAEIGPLVDISEEAARSVVRRAREKIKAGLEERGI